MIIQLPENKKDFVKDLFSAKQPNNSALWSYLNGNVLGKTFVDNDSAPTKAICMIEWTWAWVSDDADLEWTENAINEICKSTWLNVIWNPAKTEKPTKNLEVAVPRLEFVGIANKISAPEIPSVEFKFFDEDSFDKAIWKDQRIAAYGTKENFLKNAFGIYALQDGQICSESCASFTASGRAEMGAVTAENKRRQGLALATCSRVIDEALKKGLIPTWSCDAQNENSALLAKKLGFNEPKPYEILYFPQH